VREVATSGKAVFVAASAIDAAIGGGRDVTTSGKAAVLACKELIVSGTTIASIGDEASFGTFSLSSRVVDFFRLFPMPSCIAASCFVFLLLGRGISKIQKKINHTRVRQGSAQLRSNDSAGTKISRKVTLSLYHAYLGSLTVPKLATAY
jgi:hypothetical protein